MTDPSFQVFQRDLGLYLRAPAHHPQPQGTDRRRAKLYSDLLFNNISGFIDACFPVCRQVIGAKRWHRLIRTFFRDWRCHSPFFNDIPAEFVQYLQQGSIRQSLPAWLQDLAHYEWVELQVDTSIEIVTPTAAGNFLQQQPRLNPTLMNLTYAWPVHRIGVSYRPRKPQWTHLLVYRDAEHQVQFMASNAMTSRLLSILAENQCTGAQACERLAKEFQHPDPETLGTFADDLMKTLHRDGVILGVEH